MTVVNSCRRCEVRSESKSFLRLRGYLEHRTNGERSSFAEREMKWGFSLGFLDRRSTNEGVIPLLLT